ncbi:MAG: hypothetical protein EBQ76_04305 [Betaproteobacteria bacterium]|nr:hypothetical protein [Betaproteobacteria bacterium]
MRINISANGRGRGGESFNYRHLRLNTSWSRRAVGTVRGTRRRTAHVSVGVNTDDFIRRYKGKYPVMTLVERLEMLRSIRWVDEVLINKGNEDCKPLIDEVMPDLLVVGSDWMGRDFLKQIGVTREYLEKRNIALVFLPYTVGVSSTAIRARLK